MDAFTLEKQEALLATFGGNTETHGDRKKKVVDFKVTIAGDAKKVLAHLHPDLAAAVYVPDPATTEGAVDLAGPLPADLRIRRFPKLGLIPWDLECVGRDVVIDWGIDDQRNIKLAGCLINNFRIELKDGGQVALTFHVRAYPTDEQSGKLWGKLSEPIVLTVLPPAQKALAIDGTKGPPEKPAKTPKLDDAATKEATKAEVTPITKAKRGGKKEAPGIGPDDPAWPFPNQPPPGTDVGTGPAPGASA